MFKGRKQGRGYSTRKVYLRAERQRFLIVCEGEKTEPIYFDQFRTSKLVIKVEGFAKDPLQLVEKAQRLCREGEFDQVWCVFDRDDVPTDQFSYALTLAHSLKIKVAYSNQAFELWYFLHFHYCDTAMTRQDYVTRLDKCLNRPYKKNDPTLFQVLRSKQANAIRNAEQLLKQYSPHKPVIDNPSTTVHELVRELIRSSPH